MGKEIGKYAFMNNYWSDHLTNIQAYTEWRHACQHGSGNDFCEKKGLSQETMDMASLMIGQFVKFMVDAGYDGQDVTGDDYSDVAPVKKGSDEDVLLRAAMCAGFYPCFVCLHPGNRSPYWCIDGVEVQPFKGSVNFDFQMQWKDGEEWMVFSDSVKTSRVRSIMDSSLVSSAFILLFSNALMMDSETGEIRFDKWYACIEKGPWQKQLVELRNQVMPRFRDAVECRDFSVFPVELVSRIVRFLKSPPMKLRQVEAVVKSIDEEVTGGLRRNLSVFEWPEDLGEEEED